MWESQSIAFTQALSRQCTAIPLFLFTKSCAQSELSPVESLRTAGSSWRVCFLYWVSVEGGCLKLLLCRRNTPANRNTHTHKHTRAHTQTLTHSHTYTHRYTDTHRHTRELAVVVESVCTWDKFTGITVNFALHHELFFSILLPPSKI